MQDMYLSVENNAQDLLPIPYFENPVPSVASPVDYGRAPYGLAPDRPTAQSRINDDAQYCNFLSPAPRNPQMNVPYEGENKNCPQFKEKPYSKDSCYLVDSKAQGVVGIVCNQSGGSDNANFARGNQFGVDYNYDFNEREAKKKLEYTVERPVQTPIQLENPLLIYDNKPNFFPYPELEIKKNKNYITYPQVNNNTPNGDPTYVYPYKTANFPYINNDVIEKFENNKISNGMKSFIILLLFFLLLLTIAIRLYKW